MGLDTVELVMAVEEEFGIAIPDDVAPRLGRLGDLHTFAVEALGQRSGAAVDSAEVWERLKAVLVKEFAIPERQIVPEAHVVKDLGLD